MGRTPCCDKANVKRGPWSPEEDAKLKSYIEEHGTGGNWIALPHKIGLKRCGKSCRLRWLNYLRPNIKHGSFSEEEENIICTLYLNIGSRWSIIASQLPGRTDNDIKNYWNTRLKKKLMGMPRKDQQLSTRGGLVKHEMKGEVLQDLKASCLCMNMNPYQFYLPTEFPMTLTNPNHLLKSHDTTFNQYPIDTTSNQQEWLDQNSMNQFSNAVAAYHPQLPNTPYYTDGDGINLFQDFNNYPFEINEFNYNSIQLDKFDRLVGGLDNLVEGSNCTSPSAENTTCWGDLHIYPRPTRLAYEYCQHGLLHSCPSE